MMGPGWATPYNLIVVANNGRDHRRRRCWPRSTRLQTQIARNKRVDSVTGPGTINATVRAAEVVRPGAGPFGQDLQPEQEGSAQADQRTRPGRRGLGAAAGRARAGGSPRVPSQLNGGARRRCSPDRPAQLAGRARAGEGLGGSAQLSTGLNQALAGAQAAEGRRGAGADGSHRSSPQAWHWQTRGGQSLPALQGPSPADGHDSVDSAGPAQRQAAARARSARAQCRAASMADGKNDPTLRRGAWPRCRRASGAVGSTSSVIAAAEQRRHGSALAGGDRRSAGAGSGLADSGLDAPASRRACAAPRRQRSSCASGNGQLARGGIRRSGASWRRRPELHERARSADRRRRRARSRSGTAGQRHRPARLRPRRGSERRRAAPDRPRA